MEGSEDVVSNFGGYMVYNGGFSHRDKVLGISHLSLSHSDHVEDHKFVYITWYSCMFASLVFVLQVAVFPIRL